MEISTTRARQLRRMTADAVELPVTDLWRETATRARKQLHLNQGDVAKAVGVTQAAISQIESGITKSSKAVAAISELLHLPMPHILVQDEWDERWVAAGRALRSRSMEQFMLFLTAIEAI